MIINNEQIDRSSLYLYKECEKLFRLLIHNAYFC